MGADQCVEVTGSDPSTCKTCGAVIGGTKYCSACNDSGSTAAPTDGVCTTDNAVCSAKSNGVCTTCTGSSFMFKGGCYATANAPGKTMCTNAANGVCSAAADGYFVPSTNDRDASHQSVIPCGSEEEITVKNDHKYKGVAHCTQCDTPNPASDTTAVAATCTACEDGYFVAQGSAACTACDEQCATCEGTNSESKCKSCKEGYFLGATSGTAGKCIQCSSKAETNWPGVDNCAKCTSSNTQNTPATCTECADNYYLKTDGTPSCVTNCGEGFFPTTVNSIKKCVPCSETSNGGIANCAKCSLKASSTRAGAAVTCTECGSGKKLSPLKDACLTDCPAGTYDDNNVCKSCNTIAGCSTCSSGTVCTKCETGKIVKTADGATSCIDESACNNGFFVKEQDGSKTCEACDSTCKTCSGAAGQCTSCKTDTPYLKKTQLTDQTGTCTTEQECTNGNKYYVDDTDPKTCKACAEGTFEGCETCGKSTEGAVACKTCGSQKKIRPDKKGCIDACPPDVSTEKNGVCECVEGYAPTADGSSCASSSANKSGLSTGAIVGISVAAVVDCSVPLTGYLPLHNEQSKQSYYC
ncbi:Variant-specific surface protein [Giardia duodenalis]|uniref:Variant-specific surface protein n=1 Tax=Giardia intestinalis TaxID=5741 RepID=V6U1Y6_GIAIN|nr:Variant-specific surface protein [Giardia intestinalis]